MANMTYAQAVRKVIQEEMRRDDKVFVMGEDVEKLGGVFGTTRDLYKEFGTDRIRNTPISESAIVGAAVGAASAGMRPVAELMYWDFAFVAADQIFNQMCKTRYVFGGNVYALGAFYFLTSVGTGSMFVNQTVMLADVVDYGEYKLGKRNQALTFSMKGFLQKMAYTMQSIIMYAAFSMTGYDGSAAVQTAEANNAISFLMFIVPPVMIIVSLIVFLKKYRIHGEFKAEVLKAVGGEK